MFKNMIILGINASHNATSCLLRDGKIVSCISEERLTRVKNQSGLPARATKAVLDQAGISSNQVDSLVLGFKNPAINFGFSIFPQEGQGEDISLFGQKFFPFLWRTKEKILATIPASRVFYQPLVNTYYKNFVYPKLEKQVLDLIQSQLGIAGDKVIKADHHTAHLYSAYFSAPEYWKKPRLVFTLDAMGDDCCATVNVVRDGEIKRIATTPNGNSIGDLYAFVTRYLGMKMGEHEYKVMGLAPYAHQEYIDKTYQKIKDLIWVKPDLTFQTKVHSNVFYQLLDERLRGQRFDNVAGALQRLTEELLCKWVKMAVKKTGIGDLACSGGVFMNVKADQKILALPEVKSLFVMPSAGDESTAIGAAYYGYQLERKINKRLPRIEPLGDLYLGPEFSEQEMKSAIDKRGSKGFKVKKVRGIEKKIAELLAEGKIVARFAGRTEWGARALGNRSILADPSRPELKMVINDQIKNRDFWMPFAPSVLAEREKDYLVNPKKALAPYMVLAFDTTSLGKKHLSTAVHPYDFTARPQIVEKKTNPRYHKIIKEFEKLTGIGVVLNTSFNLHGYPIVCSPEDALHVFQNSGLRYLAMGNFLVSKGN